MLDLILRFRCKLIQVISIGHCGNSDNTPVGNNLFKGLYIPTKFEYKNTLARDYFQ